MNLCTVGTANKGLTSVRDVYEPIPDDVEHFGVDHGGPLPLNNEVDDLEIPETPSPLNRDHTRRVHQLVAASLDSDYGYSIFNTSMIS